MDEETCNQVMKMYMDNGFENADQEHMPYYIHDLLLAVVLNSFLSRFEE